MAFIKVNNIPVHLNFNYTASANNQLALCYIKIIILTKVKGLYLCLQK